MKNHFIHVYLFLLIVAALFSSCNNADRMALDDQTDATTAESDITLVDGGGSESVTYEPIIDENSGEPPRSISFESMEQISMFVQAAKGSETEWQQYWEQNEYQMSYFSQHEVRQIAETMEGHLYPFAKEGVKVDGFNVELTPQYSKLDITFRVNGFTTRFVYFYTETNLPNYDYELVYTNMPIGDTTMNLYNGGQGIDCVRGIGSIVMDNTLVSIVMYPESFSDIPMNHFDNFEFCEIGS